MSPRSELNALRSSYFQTVDPGMSCTKADVSNLLVKHRNVPRLDRFYRWMSDNCCCREERVEPTTLRLHTTVLLYC
ncbi:hypothetical protein F2P81_023059 [Scophthalmus maximus]|uniref:Uncharacterized protein n=1 Tax=Scophthalmus maximus TaxID=52904 RepID=A0A6A4RVA8_SCOMX|nr:hypothetical protein F2P81_023059 [Scophthalmus maximus]